MNSFTEIAAAAIRLKPLINRTPLLESERVNQQLGGRLLIKPECIQKTGSFKIRGATNRISQLTVDEREAGVIAFSSGNHAQGVALAAKMHDVAATIVMPADAPQMKINNTRSYGAEVLLYDRYKESREEIVESIRRDTGAVLVPPFDDPHIIAGQGTVGVECVEQADAKGIAIDDFVVCISGGGLSSGCAVAFAEKSPKTRVWVAEPHGFDDCARSLEAGHHVRNDPTARSICDALLLPTPGELTFPILQSHNVKGLVCTDEEVKAAMRLAFEEFKLVVEPGGAVALACVLNGRIPVVGQTVCVVCTGGNVDPEFFRGVLS